MHKEIQWSYCWLYICICFSFLIFVKPHFLYTETLSLVTWTWWWNKYQFMHTCMCMNTGAHKHIITYVWVIIQCTSPVPPFLPFIFLQSTFRFWQLHKGKPWSHVLMLLFWADLSNQQQVLSTLLAPRAWRWGSPVPDRVGLCCCSRWSAFGFLSPVSWGTPVLSYVVIYFSFKEKPEEKHNAILKEAGASMLTRMKDNIF